MANTSPGSVGLWLLSLGYSAEWLMRARRVFHSLRMRPVAQTQQQFTIVGSDIRRFGVWFAVVRPAPGRQATSARRPSSSSALCLH